MSAKNPRATYAMSRHRRSIIFGLCLLLIAVLIWLDHTTVEHKLQSRPKSEERLRARDFERYHGKTFTVVKIVDGDTIDIDIPDGKYDHTRIRLWGIDTPETKNPKTGVMYFGPEAAEFAKKLSHGKKIVVYLEEHRTRGKFGRLLAYVQLPDKRFLNKVLLSEGFAYADTRFRHSLYHTYKQLEATARSQKKGLWPDVTHEQLPQWLQRKKPNLLLKK